MAIATDTPLTLERDIPQFDLDDIDAIADFISDLLGLAT
jgi:hypothetical protein